MKLLCAASDDGNQFEKWTMAKLRMPSAYFLLLVFPWMSCYDRALFAASGDEMPWSFAVV